MCLVRPRLASRLHIEASDDRAKCRVGRGTCSRWTTPRSQIVGSRGLEILLGCEKDRHFSYIFLALFGYVSGSGLYPTSTLLSGDANHPYACRKKKHFPNLSLHVLPWAQLPCCTTQSLVLRPMLPFTMPSSYSHNAVQIFQKKLNCNLLVVRSIEGIAHRFKIPHNVAGATLMAMGASTPELVASFVGVFVAAESATGAGTVIGSVIL